MRRPPDLEIGELRRRIAINETQFARDATALLMTSFATLISDRRLGRCYEAATSIQAWRAYALEVIEGSHAGQFFREAQNDLLLSWVLAAHGLWRPALQSLRSFIEGVLATFYYVDHPVELDLWGSGEHKMEFSDYMRYYQRHPLMKSLPAKVNPLPLLTREYAELSRAVHASSAPYRMTTSDLFPRVSAPDQVSLSKWETRCLRTLQAINLLLIAFKSKEVEGARRRQLRQAVSLGLSASQRKELRAHFGIRLFDLS